jgi:hypothetical protein
MQAFTQVSDHWKMQPSRYGTLGKFALARMGRPQQYWMVFRTDRWFIG